MPSAKATSDPDVDPADTAHAVLVAQLGLIALGRTGMGVDALTTMARTALVRLLPSGTH